MKIANMRQGGISATGFIIILVIIGFFTMIALKLIPVYFENFKIKSVLESLKDEPGIGDKTNIQIGNIIAHRFIIENIDRVKSDQVKIRRDRTKVLLDLEYEIRNDLVGNVDLVVSFKDRVEIEGH